MPQEDENAARIHEAAKRFDSLFSKNSELRDGQIHEESQGEETAEKPPPKIRIPSERW